MNIWRLRVQHLYNPAPGSELVRHGARLAREVTGIGFSLSGLVILMLSTLAATAFVGASLVSAVPNP